ncbi:PIN domain-containing protein [Candidatus Thiodiazotropha sp. CDECU1]|uniref:PIN domain-containing protein n=1 Tax=Candidatus Thiodiazotropha sp. CDECU1 TaxID=3065865 RepID=UPI00292E1E0E|nr:PIN domain-containing protein [Candidatus Thiodiazotropha sp. CDECU1]
MEVNYVLIDFENVQPKNLEILSRHPFKILVFVGANQTKVSFDLASAMQTLGSDAKYIKIAGNGPNALDFHIAFYIGELASKDQSAHFNIISKDKGFDPLVAHLKTRGFKVQRSSDLAEIPILRVSGDTSTDEKISTIVTNLISRGQARPRKVKTLQNTINTLFTKKLDNEEMQKVVSTLSQQKYIQINDGNVSYNLKKTH